MARKPPSAKGKHPDRRRPAVLAAALLVCVCALLAAGLLLPLSASGGAPDSFYLEQERAGVSAYFFQRYGVELDSGGQAWAANYGGEVPDQLLRERAEEQERHDEALRTLAGRYGLEPLPTIERMEEDLGEFNRQRAQTLEQGGVIYGPERYEFLTYYRSQRDAAETALMEFMMDDALEHHNDLLLELYDEMDTKALTSRQAVTLGVYQIDPEEFVAHPEEAAAAQQAIISVLERGAAPGQRELTALTGFPVSRQELELDSGAISREDGFSAQLLALASEAEAGTCFLGPYAPDSAFTCIYQILSVDVSRPRFEEVRPVVAAQYANERLDSEIAELTEIK